MGTTDQDPKLFLAPPLKSGIAGFAVDPDLGFVCVLAGENNASDDNDNDNDKADKQQRKRFTYAIVSPQDTEKLSSAEALCLVQLAGGLDLGAAVFPPETLARLVAGELEEDDDDDADEEGEEIVVQALRSKVTLLGVTAVRNEEYSPTIEEDSRGRAGAGGDASSSSQSTSSPERDAKINDAAPKMFMAVKNLPGLSNISTPHQIIQAMQIHADADGNLDRAAFSELLGTLRGGRNRGSNDQKVKFRITASISDNGGGGGSKKSNNPLKLVNVENVPPFQAVALAMRYKLTVLVSEDSFIDHEGHDDDDAEVENDGAANVLNRFPAFKPVHELLEDAQVMGGFISTMFFKQNAPKNDDKL